jgi:UDP-GlcNAc:undecaprenyl-phosphate/decaprenyl-phosphate GlcNAc-1-phosphate transferase
MTELTLVLLTSFTLTFLVMPLFIKYLSKKEILDMPGGRKIHRGAKPSLGGIPIFLSFVVATLIWLPLSSWSNMKFLFLALTLIFLIGVRDDILPIRAIYKLAGQIISASIIILLMDVRIQSFEGFLGIHAIPWGISVGLTFIFIIVLTNAINLIDGLDGLASTVALIALTALAVWFYLNNNNTEALIAFSLTGAILGFLVFNWEPSLIFMGDTGSLFIGLTICYILIQFLNHSVALPDESILKFNCPIAFAISTVITPLTDTARIIILRIYKGYSPFKPDKNHIHHAIMRLGTRHGVATLILGSFQLACLLICIAFRREPDKIMLPVIIFSAILASLILDQLITGKTKRRN